QEPKQQTELYQLIGIQTYAQDKNISKILQFQQELLQMQQGDMDLTESSSSFFCRRFLAVAWECALFVLFVMAAEMGSQKDVVLDAASASKTENVPIQVTSIRLTKDNYLSWSAALEIGITSRGRLPYITGDKPPPLKSDPQWATWALEDSQVKVWIISSVSADIQPLILRKPTSFDMWNVLAKMYGRKKRHLHTYQIKRSIYSLKQGDLSVAAFYAALKTKWEELDYHVSDEWKCGLDHSLHWENEWMDRTFLFLGGLRDEFEPIRSQILNGDDIPGIEEVYDRVESEEQRRLVMHPDASLLPLPLLVVPQVRDLPVDALIVISLVILWISVGIFIPKKDLSEVVLLWASGSQQVALCDAPPPGGSRRKTGLHMPSQSTPVRRIVQQTLEGPTSPHNWWGDLDALRCACVDGQLVLLDVLAKTRHHLNTLSRCHSRLAHEVGMAQQEVASGGSDLQGDPSADTSVVEPAVVVAL
ncbi:hypothetical protein EJ110_NYTH52698, partial [Nymphaea thermarum]